MKNIAILGDSHVVALYDAYSGLLEYFPDTKVTFFSVGAAKMAKVKFENKSIVPGDDYTRKHFEMSSGGIGEIDSQQYDVFVLVGMQPTNIHQALSLVEHAPIGYEAPRHLISQNCFDKTLVSRITTHPSYLIATWLCTLAKSPIFLIKEPFANRQHKIQDPKQMKADNKRHWALAKVAQSDDWKKFSRHFDNLFRETFLNVATILSQPQETIIDECFTANEYYESDNRHVNRYFGRLQLEETLKAVQ